MPTIEELQARIAAQATQVALLHNALRAAAAYIGPVDGPRAGGGNDDERKAAARVVEAAINTGEGELLDVLQLIRDARPVVDGARIAVSVPGIMKLMERFERLGLIPPPGSTAPRLSASESGDRLEWRAGG